MVGADGVGAARAFAGEAVSVDLDEVMEPAVAITRGMTTRGEDGDERPVGEGRVVKGWVDVAERGCEDSSGPGSDTSGGHRGLLESTVAFGERCGDVST